MSEETRFCCHCNGTGENGYGVRCRMCYGKGEVDVDDDSGYDGPDDDCYTAMTEAIEKYGVP
jgi:hypothetical protein